MVTIGELRKQIEVEKRKRTILAKKSELFMERKRLQKELKTLKSPTRRSAIRLGKRLRKGLKVVITKSGKGIIKQAKLIKEQQIRDERTARKQTLKKLKIQKRKASKSGGIGIFQQLDF